MSITNLITKTLISGAIVLGPWVVGAAPAIADANSFSTNPVRPNPGPFSVLHYDCPPTAPANSPDRMIRQGLRDGLTAPLQGLPAARQ
ncbi:hypothetical protein MMAN_46700 [Mycobacterium mantenii]|uniref:Uncharacterized protein n=1 Tax=Mycobacterium mantenii TaxID=560555 RepID=A0A1X0FTS6_MYCNT|nr:hypothetical protein [Mycobacterium mantenii]MCV7243907.1 hypothetical protein [Mycobacterium mantenii]ORB05177.1 hypothetical protein BST30_14355 [Mycobacterium mantenii]BBY40536.1 hypothetical protein MMAN_46700 [Mycobacterium mantenii]